MFLTSDSDNRQVFSVRWRTGKSPSDWRWWWGRNKNNWYLSWASSSHLAFRKICFPWILHFHLPVPSDRSCFPWTSFLFHSEGFNSSMKSLSVKRKLHFFSLQRKMSCFSCSNCISNSLFHNYNRLWRVYFSFIHDFILYLFGLYLPWKHPAEMEDPFSRWGPVRTTARDEF